MGGPSTDTCSPGLCIQPARWPWRWPRWWTVFFQELPSGPFLRPHFLMRCLSPSDPWWLVTKLTSEEIKQLGRSHEDLDSGLQGWSQCQDPVCA